MSLLILDVEMCKHIFVKPYIFESTDIFAVLPSVMIADVQSRKVSDTKQSCYPVDSTVVVTV